MKFNPELDLKIERVIDLTPEQVWKAWTMPEHLKQWFCPKPWSVADCEVDLRPGGRFYTTMQSPEGDKFPNQGCFLELVENKKIVFTDALLEDFRPKSEFMMTGHILIEAQGTGTKYTAIACHKNLEDRKKHEDMGFAQGWNMALDQLITHMKSL